MKILHSLKIAGLPLAALCLLAASPVRAADTSYSSETSTSGDAAGNYDSKIVSESTDAEGTTTTNVKTEKIESDASGNVKVEKSTKAVVDPAGLGNKAVTEITESSETNAAGDIDSETAVKAKTANVATDTDVTKKTLRVDSKGNRMSKITRKKTHDPKGLMNKTTTETTELSETKDGRIETSHETTVDGKVVESTEQNQ